MDIKHLVPGQKTLERTCVFRDDVEKLLCDWIKMSCAKGFPVTKDGLCYSVQKIANKTKQKLHLRTIVLGGNGLSRL